MLNIFWCFLSSERVTGLVRGPYFKVKFALQKWSQTSLISILALHDIKKWAKNIKKTFQYLPRSIDTIILVVYEPYRALEGLQGVWFQGKNCFIKNGLKLFRNRFWLYITWRNEQIISIWHFGISPGQYIQIFW